jgi:hypothetical protein
MVGKGGRTKSICRHAGKLAKNLSEKNLYPKFAQKKPPVGNRRPENRFGSAL